MRLPISGGKTSLLAAGTEHLHICSPRDSGGTASVYAMAYSNSAIS